MKRNISSALPTVGNKSSFKWPARSGLFKACAGLLLAGCAFAANASVAPVTTQGNQVLFGGQQGSVSGMSLFWDIWGFEKFYNAGTVGWINKDWNAKLVRAVMAVDDAGGYLSDPGSNKARVKAVVDAAVANDMYVIIDWHSHHAQWNTGAAVDFFREMAQTYKDTPNVIFEIFNEPWDDVYWSSQIKPYAMQVIPAIRNTGAKNLIIVGTRAWSQRVDEAAADRITGFDNIAYTLHFYAASHGQWLRDTAQGALNSGIPLFVTEWGSVDALGKGAPNSGETWAWADFMKKNNLSNANWSLGDKDEGASALTPGASATGGWTNNQLTASGALAKDIISHWPQAGGNSNSSGSSSSSGGVTPGTCTTAAIGQIIQAEAFCNSQGIKTEPTTDDGQGLNVGYIDAGDWMSYEVDVPAAGSYTITYRVASANGGGIIQSEKAGGNPVYGTTNVPSTGGWQTWVNVTQVVQLSAGKQTIGLAAKAGGFNINWLKVDSNNPGNSSSSSSSSSGNGTPLVTIQAESFSQMSGVQTENTSDDGLGLNVGWIDAGDWLSYAGTPVNIPRTGSYKVEFRVASYSGANLKFEEAGGNPVYAPSVAIPATGGWQKWTTVSTTVNLTAGSHKFGIAANTGGWNINWFRITPQ